MEVLEKAQAPTLQALLRTALTPPRAGTSKNTQRVTPRSSEARQGSRQCDATPKAKCERVLPTQQEPRVKGPLPKPLRTEQAVVHFDTAEYGIYQATVAMLERTGEVIGQFRSQGLIVEGERAEAEGLLQLEEYGVRTDIFRSFKARQVLYQAVGKDETFLKEYVRLIEGVVLPHLKATATYQPQLRIDKTTN